MVFPAMTYAWEMTIIILFQDLTCETFFLTFPDLTDESLGTLIWRLGLKVFGPGSLEIKGKGQSNQTENKS